MNKISIKMVVFILTTLSVLKGFAQDKLPITNLQYQTIHHFYKKVKLIVQGSAHYDSMSFQSEVKPLFILSHDKIKGIYLLIPPLDPETQFVLLIDDSYHPLDTKDMAEDMLTIVDFLRKNKSKISAKELLTLLEELSKSYQLNKLHSYHSK